MPTILIVDDNKRNLQVLGNILNEKLYKVAMATDGPTALKLAPKLKPDLIVLDIMMPGMDGFEVCSILKNDPGTAEIPIIFLTAKIDMEDIVKGFQLGGADYVTKPFKKEELLARINNHLELVFSRRKIEKQAQDLLALNNLKDKIFTVVATDFKGALDSFTEVPRLLSGPQINLTSKETTGILNDLHNKATSTYNLVENVLWWSRAQQKLVSPKLSRVNILQCVTEALALNHHLAQNKKQEISVGTGENLTVVADQALLVLKNLISNAMKYTRKGGKISITAQQQGENTTIGIADKGVGMGSEQVAQVLDKLTYHTEYGTDNEKGSGLGLKLVAELMGLMGARLEIESTEGSGTTVLLQFTN